jgi:hypothetical protein
VREENAARRSRARPASSTIPPDHVELALERDLVVLEARAGADEQLAHVGPRAVGDVADVVLVDGDVAPAQDALALDADVQLEQLLDLRARAGSVGRKHWMTP